MARPRNPLNARLPANLSMHHASGQFRYRHPQTKQDIYLGRNRADAIDAANKANAILLPKNDLLEKIIGRPHALAECIQGFREEEIPAREWKPKTLKEYAFKLNRIEADIAQWLVQQIQVKDCDEYLREVTKSQRSRAQYRSVLVWLFDYALRRGWTATNPAAGTRVSKSRRQRSRLPLRHFLRLREMAAPWLANAMDLSLLTLLRRADVCALRFEDIHDGCLWVIPRKTESSTYVRLQMVIDGELANLIERCGDGVESPYLIHRLPERAKPSDQRAVDRTHHTEVLPEQLTRAFNELVTESGLFHGDKNPPTFHEIRSLGSALYLESGWPLERVQQLAGHASAAMTKHYLSGHDAPWVRVTADLTLDPAALPSNGANAPKAHRVERAEQGVSV